MFKTIARPDHSERILATPPQHCISLNEARMLKGILLQKLPPGSTVAILGAPANRPDVLRHGHLPSRALYSRSNRVRHWQLRAALSAKFHSFCRSNLRGAYECILAALVAATEKLCV
jgi:hypothetical protein